MVYCDVEIMTRNYRAETAASITALAQRIMETNLCKEIVQPMKLFSIQSKSKYQFTRANWYVADFDTQYYFEVEQWCKEQFGPHPK